MTDSNTFASVRYVVDDVQAAPGPASSGARATPDDAAMAGRNRIHLVVADLDAEIDRLREAGVPLRSEPTAGPGGRQVLVADPAGNLVELFEPGAGRP